MVLDLVLDHLRHGLQRGLCELLADLRRQKLHRFPILLTQ